MLEFEGNSIQVAVRLRPMLMVKYNRHESEKGRKRVIEIEDSTTLSVTHPEDDANVKTFGFTQCYWSFDGYAELQDGHFVPDPKHPNGNKYCDQKRLFDQFGKEIIQNTWSGNNSVLTCFGQTGSGKSWSLLGNNLNKGFVSLLSLELFKSIREKEKGLSAQSGNSFEVKCTIMEIYEEKVRDLLFANNIFTKYKHTLKIREHPKRGFYVEGLRSVSISSAEEFQQKVDEGLLNRAMASTVYNLISSQGTVVIGLSLVQKYRNAKGDEQTMSASIDFFDLQGSESYPGEDTDESNILQNKAIRTLESCVNGLIESSMKIIGEKHVSIPYKESTVTKLLEKALRGNCKSYFLATISPSDLSYGESLSTLVFADKIQRLKTNPVVNDELTSKLIRELKIENESLKRMLTSGDLGKNDFFSWTDKLDLLSPLDTEEFRKQIIEDIKSQMRDNEREIKGLTQSSEEKLKLGKVDKFNDMTQAAKKLEIEKKNKPYIYNLNSDSQLSARLIYVLSPGILDFGSFKGKESFLVLTGIGIREHHGTFIVHPKDSNHKTTIKPFAPDCLISVNGQEIQYETTLFHNDRYDIYY